MKFNIDNRGYESNYPLYLGEPLGVLDTINTNYPIFEDLYQTQLSQLWNEFEVPIDQDSIDMLKVDKGTTDLMVKTIMWQTCADGMAATSIIETFGKYISNPELYNMKTLWAMFEVIHARTYAHIIKQTFSQPNEMLNEMYADVEVMTRLSTVGDAFQALSTLPDDASMAEKQDCLLLALSGLFLLESVCFLASFSVTFGIGNTRVFQGISKLVQLICRDEVLHTRMANTIMQTLRNDPEWADSFERTQAARQDLFNEVVIREITWSAYLFSEGRGCVGLSEDRLNDYVFFLAKPVAGAIDVKYTFPVVKANPCEYMNDYVSGSNIQVAPQEMPSSSYLVGVTVDDTDDIDFDDF